ncbi:hypothetical protein J8349_23190 [Escherichia coli]|nr:hypothetical protein [Escherichia coli]
MRREMLSQCYTTN